MTTIIDTTSGDAITGRIGRFAVTSSRRGEAHEGTPGVFEGVRPGIATGRGARALVAAILAADAHNADRTNGFVRVVSVYDAGQQTWWPCSLSRETV
jgi:hypothetical protein